MTTSPTFTETFTVTADNPLLRGHVVYGRSLLPGVGYVDLVLQVLSRQGHPMPEVELRNLTILAPLVAGPGEAVRTTVEGRPVESGGWRVEVRSRRAQDATDVLHAVVTAHHRDPATFTERLSLPVQGVSRRTTMDEIYTWCREYDLLHSGLMKLGGAVHHRPGDWIAEVELAPEHHSSTGAFLFHPALFEAGLLGGGVALGMLHGDNDGPGLYLPLMFDRFRAAGPLGGRCYVRVPADSVRRDDELIRLVVEFYDETGQKVAEVGQFVAKRIRTAGALDVRGDAPAPQAAVPAPAPAAPVVESVSVLAVLRELVGSRLGVPVDAVDVGLGYYELGLESADLLALVGELEGRLSVELSPTVMFEYRTIAELAAWLESQVPAGTVAAAQTVVPVPAPAPTPVPAAPVVESVSVLAVLRELVGSRLGVPVDAVDVGLGYYELGLESADLLALVGELESRLSVELSPTVMFEYRTIAELAAWLESQVPAGTVAAAQTVVPVPAAQAVPDSLTAVRATLTEEVAALLGVDPADVHPDAELGEFGLDLGGRARLAERVTELYGPHLLPGGFGEHRTLQAMALQLVGDHGVPGVRGTSAAQGDSPGTGAPPTHPLLQLTVPGGPADEVTYETRFDGSEPYLRDHQVRGGRVLPGVAQLEMARVAVARALGREDTAAVRLTDVVWLRAAVYGPDGLTLRVRVRTGGAGCTYEVLSVGADGDTTLCGQGRASLAEDVAGRRTLSLAELRAACTEATYSGEHIYGLYGGLGLAYGPSQRSLTELRTGRAAEGGRQVLAELRLPEAAEPLHGGLMHPSILDGALQATIGLWLGDGGSAALALPFALTCAEAVAVTPATAYAWIRHRPGSGTDRASAQLDVTVVDEQGRVCAELTGLSSRPLPAAQTAGTGQTAHAAASAESAQTPESAEPPVGAGTAAPGDVAIIGVSGRYPQAADLDEFWENLRTGRDCIREVPADRWNDGRYAGAGAGGWGGFLDDIDRFDPLFFQISLLEADYLDPQERLFLQCAHHTLEDAGYTAERLSRGAKVGVFVGVMYQEYQLLGAQAQERGEPAALWGSASTVANRVSYFYDFHGPSLAVDTMCSSSLTAIHLACEALRSGQCATALAGGVNLTPHPNKYLVLGQRKFLSSDGRCRSFGEGGDGYVPGEGVGAVLLKPLERAVADGDRVLGVIKGTAVNHGGRTSGYSVPTPVAQGEVIADALGAAGVDPRSLSYLEAHGTGTSLGDPIEVSGLTQAFRRAGGAPGQLAMGSVKSNIGHLESAAGIAALTKVLLQLRHGELVPSLHAETLNPHIDFDRTPLRVQRTLEPWHRPVVDGDDGERRTLPRVAGISSFGGGGSNAHVVVAEYQPPARPARTPADGRPALLVLSAKSEAQLVEQALRLHARLGEATDADLPAIAWTLQTGRMALEERLAFAVSSLAEARERLAAFTADPAAQGSWHRGTARPDRAADAAAVRAALDAWTRQSSPEDLLAGWADGADVEWEHAWPAGSTVRRISLPGYPFARERCWFDIDTEGAPQRPASGDAPAPVGPGSVVGPDSADVVLLRPEWTDRATAPATPGEFLAERHVVVLGRFADSDRATLRAALSTGADCTVLDLADGPLDRQYADAVRQVFTLTRRLLEQGVRRPTLLQVVLVGDSGRPGCLSGLAGLLRTAHLENPKLHTQYVECLDGAPPATVLARLAAEATADPEPEVRHRDGRRQARRLTEVTDSRPAPAPWREGGVYLITGGIGGLGLITARDIAATVDRATVVLTGRSPLTGERRAALDGLRAAGLTVRYESVDVTDRGALAALLSRVAGEHGPLTGVLHAAGVIEDNFIVRKSSEELDRVLAPKVAGLVHLDELTREQPLDLFVCFSSIAGAFGNPGQSDYAAANAFMDAYAAHRDELVGAGLRNGRTVSVNWPLWDEGGMGAEGPVREQLRAAGLAPLDTERGLAALHRAVAGAEGGTTGGRLLVVAGDREALLSRLTEPAGEAAQSAAPQSAAAPAPDAPAPATATGGGSVRSVEDRAVAHLRRVLASALKLGPERLDPDTPLERYGMDSVLAVTMVQPLEDTFGPLSRTLLLEVRTVRGLARYLADEHAQPLRALVGEAAPEPARPQAAAPGAHRPQAAAPVTARSNTATATAPVPPAAGQDIAVIGIHGRYPHADDLEEFWSVLREGRDCVTEVPADRWKTDGGARYGAFLDGVDRFDPLHFGISPREAAAMDPQQRLFLETVWHLLEQGGVTQEVIERRYGRSVGVYVGAAYQMYRADASEPVLAALTSSASYNLIANRVSHFFGLEGPSLAVDSMCTSSAMAVHLACADLLRGECELAVAGGVNLTVHEDKYVALSEMQLLGTHPGARSFRDGDGYLPAEAVGAVLLKPLDAALRDGDTVLAVIKSTSSLHAGRSGGFMAPSHRTQVATMRRALERAGAEPGSVGYVESAANGTAFSDEVELRALREVFAGVTTPVPVGAVKSNLGHPEAASGIAQLTKVVLQLQHGRIAPLVQAGTANPHLDLDGSPLELCDRLTDWEPRNGTDTGGPSQPRRALINCVAAGGSHVSLVVEAPPATAEAPTVTPDSAPQIVVVSARTEERLHTAVSRLLDHLAELSGEDGPDSTVSLADIAYTTQLGREPLAERLAVVAADRDELARALADHVAGAPTTVPVYRGNADDDAGPWTSVLSGPRSAAFLAGLAEDRALEELAALWVRGVRVPWSALHTGRSRMVPLPATAFEAGSYWVGRDPQAAVPGTREPEHVPPAGAGTDAEQVMAQAWADVLQVDAATLSARTDFLSLGGNSLLATRLINLLKERAGVELPVEAVFAAPRLSDMARELGERLLVAADTSTPELDLILESLVRVEHMDDEELDALDIES
ncbi:SDR family NAD(P)-dependent oxidoreductase [Streptomyces sp. b94]|uniref:SDR family NAD(P)-dependent oxidoreductase n=1 Tax=Streptomyces sp. b94 TaxID=1827634 RepID=UPI001B38B09A|nr:SDR family NAD(P)-dependent oxidoreductase [Streptomyces sp. b94]MBQ1098887.1 SDR family NAD(P)-dependent oxidoreductase [Streptomyces sp. b94]